MSGVYVAIKMSAFSSLSENIAVLNQTCTHTQIEIKSERADMLVFVYN